jgi:hypothetical protein
MQARFVRFDLAAGQAVERGYRQSLIPQGAMQKRFELDPAATLAAPQPRDEQRPIR